MQFIDCPFLCSLLLSFAQTIAIREKIYKKVAKYFNKKFGDLKK
jgi:hypothetical protein